MNEPQPPKPNSYKTLKARVLSILDGEPDRTFTPLELFLGAGIEEDRHNLGYAILSRLARNQEVERPRRGLYASKCRGSLSDQEPPVRFHNIHLVLGNGARPLSEALGIQTRPNAKPTPDGKTTLSMCLGPDRRAQLLLSRSVEVRIACTDNPLSPKELAGVLLGFDAAFGLGFDEKPWMVASLEINRDFRDLRIDGANCLTLKHLDGTILKAYNKGRDVRVESRVLNVPLVEALETLKGKPAIGNEKIGSALGKLVSQYRRLNERLDEHLVLHHEAGFNDREA